MRGTKPEQAQDMWKVLSFAGQTEARSCDLARVKWECGFMRNDIQMTVIPITVKNKCSPNNVEAES